MKTSTSCLLAGFTLLSSLSFSQNVGIGTLTPTSAKLEISGAGTQLVTRAGDNLTGISHSIPLGISPSLAFNLNNVNGGFRLLGAGYGAVIQYSPSTGILYFTTSQTKGAPGDLLFFNSNNVAIDSNGYLGIGTTAPKARFHALNAVIGANAITPATGYILSVGGKIICEEVKVQLNASWPDYVFEPNYYLPTLEELEASVMTNKHLPGIPSAIDINNQAGYEMGDMQKKMLEKMEELYRYVFEVNRQNKQLKEKVAVLEKRFNEH